MSTALIMFTLGVIIGVIVGWVWRTVVFIRNQDCADPNHHP